MRTTVAKVSIASIVLTLTLTIASCSGGDTRRENQGVKLVWTPPTEYEDGTSLPLEEIAEYRVYVDQQLVTTIERGRTEHFLELAEGEWVVTVSVVAGGVESRPAEPVVVVID